MNKAITLPGLILALSSLFACKKDEMPTRQVQLIDHITAQPIPGITVKSYVSCAGTTSWNAGCSNPVYKYEATDGNGMAAVTLNDYAITTVHSEYYDISRTESYPASNKDVYHLFLKAQGKIRVNFNYASTGARISVSTDATERLSYANENFIRFGTGDATIVNNSAELIVDLIGDLENQILITGDILTNNLDTVIRVTPRRFETTAITVNL